MLNIKYSLLWLAVKEGFFIKVIVEWIIPITQTGVVMLPVQLIVK
ncbi:hypothetical protein BN1180_03420 [Peribacillus simplex]|uniref:Uncharacterized protein n=1 Tax=Peribacillus simplex TaxID=1478 RepID=A0AAN2TTN8_9BACI|nr:hypothetical protein BN1180_03420 [Peribacillus simplex]CRH72183.1 Uncharacterised protein [Chlamydia trachomatis]CRH88626.1 Uncharacterised protein [Chlamydia trachomatis]